MIDVQQPLEMVLQLAVSGMAGADVRESLVITRDGEPVTAREVTLPGEGRAHVLWADPGRVDVGYQATVRGRAPRAEVTEADRLRYLRPSRYAESDRLAAVACAEFAGRRPGPGPAGRGVVLGRHPAQLRAGQQQADRRRGEHAAEPAGGVP